MEEAHLPYAERIDQLDFRELMVAYGQDVWNLAYILTKRHEVADDISQDVFLNVFKSISSFRGGSSVRTWLLSITRNAAISYLRTAYVRKVSLMDWITEKAHSPSAEIEAVERQLSDEIWSRVISLPYKLREVLILHAKYDWSMREIADLLQISEGAVKTRLFRARRLMSKGREEDPLDD